MHATATATVRIPTAIMPCSHRYAASVHAANATERLNDAASVIRAATP